MMLDVTKSLSVRAVCVCEWADKHLHLTSVVPYIRNNHNKRELWKAESRRNN